jgi:hypothetical protein
MGNALEGQTYVKGSHKSIQPKIASNVDAYKSHQRISSSSNIHSQMSFTRPNKSENAGPPKKSGKRIGIDDITVIEDEGYDWEVKYAVKKLPFRNQINLTML